MKGVIPVTLILQILLLGQVLGQCPPMISITTQEEIDLFAVNYPDCDGTGLMLDINGQGSNITNLNGLAQLETLGWLGIFFTNLSDFEGMENLQSVATQFRILGNFELHSLEGFNSLTEVGDTVRIVLNTELLTLNGLQNLTAVAGNVEIQGNSALQDLNGLNSLIGIGGSLNLSSHPNLISIGGLEGLQTVGSGNLDALTIFNNPQLQSLDGLEQLEVIDGTLTIQNCNSLTSLFALESLTEVTSTLEIRTNELLSACSINFICQNLENPTVNFVVADNAEGCNTIQQIQSHCLGLGVNGSTIDLIKLYPNPAKDLILLPFSMEVSVYAITGQLIWSGFSDHIDCSSWGEGMYLVRTEGPDFSAVHRIVKE